jgi:hypothetical protein
MKLSDINGQLVSLVTSGLALVLGLLAAFHVLSLTSQENTAIMGVAIAVVGLGIYAYGLIHSWATASYDQARVTTLITGFVAAVTALLDAFGVFKFDQTQQAAVLGVSGGIAFMGGILFSYLHTAKQVALVKLQLQRQQDQPRRNR